MEYTRDSFGAPVEPIEGKVVCFDFKGDEIYENEEICVYHCMDGLEKIYRPDDQDEFIQSLEKDDLIEILLSINKKEVEKGTGNYVYKYA